MEAAIRLFFRPPTPIPFDEPVRQGEVDALPCRGDGDAALDQIAAAAAGALGAPTGLVSLVDRERVRFVGRFNFAVRDMSRAEGLCAHGVLNPRDLLCVPNLLADRRFADLRLAHGPDAIRFYAGAPLVSRGGRALGMLCVIDTMDRAMPGTEQCRALQRLARTAAHRLEGAGA